MSFANNGLYKSISTGYIFVKSKLKQIQGKQNEQNERATSYNVDKLPIKCSHLQDDLCTYAPVSWVRKAPVLCINVWLTYILH